jgi:hypothetical protein
VKNRGQNLLLWGANASDVSICAGSGAFVAVGFNGVILSSTDGTNWTKRTAGTILRPVYGLAYGKGRYVAVGESYGLHGQLITSTDGINWSDPITITGDSSATVDSVSFVHDVFIASVESENRIWISQDGLNWSPTSTPYLNFPIVYQTIYANGLFVGAGGSAYYGAIVTSYDGTNWLEKTISFASLRSVAYANGQYVVVGGGIQNSQGVNEKPGGIILMSPDGTNWTELDRVTPSGGLTGVAYGNGRFVAVASDGTVFVSSDGTSWPLPTAPSINTAVNSVVFGNGQFVASGGNVVWSSVDGISWIRHDINSSVVGSGGFTYQNGSFWCLGDMGAILECRVVPYISQVQTSSNGSKEVTILGVNGRTNSVESSTDLTNWATVATTPLTNGVGMVSEPKTADLGRRFYRAVAR